MECLHHGRGCDNCECQCDGCQEIFETAWEKHVEEENLCMDCGVPKVVTLESLIKEQYTHFFQPCPACAPVLKACLAAANLCETCRAPLNGICKKCTCLGTDECECHECSNTLHQPCEGVDVSQQQQQQQ